MGSREREICFRCVLLGMRGFVGGVMGEYEYVCIYMVCGVYITNGNGLHNM
jgi:hypothetical protein